MNRGSPRRRLSFPISQAAFDILYTHNAALPACLFPPFACSKFIRLIVLKSHLLPTTLIHPPDSFTASDACAPKPLDFPDFGSGSTILSNSGATWLDPRCQPPSPTGTSFTPTLFHLTHQSVNVTVSPDLCLVIVGLDVRGSPIEHPKSSIDLAVRVLISKRLKTIAENVAPTLALVLQPQWMTACGLNFAFGVYQELYEALNGPLQNPFLRKQI